MSLGPVMLDIDGTQLTQEDYEILNHPLVGGVILFSRNYQNPTQLTALVRALRDIKSPPLLIAVDQEGGRVQRFVDGFVKLPALQSLGDLYQTDSNRAKQLTAVVAKIMAQELLACGVDMSFAPVLDIKTADSSVIGGLQRSFSADPQVVSELASVYIDAMHQAGMKATGKHFPGHGSVVGDSHTSILQDQRCLPELEAVDLLPFKNLLPKLFGMMMAHVIFPQVDQQPAGFSKFWVQDYLRDTLKFSGLIFTDALDMKGAGTIEKFSQRVMTALNAGCDMALVCNNRTAAIEVLDNAQVNKNIELEKRMNNLRGQCKYDWDALHASDEWCVATQLLTQGEF